MNTQLYKLKTVNKHWPIVVVWNRQSKEENVTDWCYMPSYQNKPLVYISPWIKEQRDINHMDVLSLAEFNRLYLPM